VSGASSMARPPAATASSCRPTADAVTDSILCEMPTSGKRCTAARAVIRAARGRGCRRCDPVRIRSGFPGYDYLRFTTRGADTERHAWGSVIMPAARTVSTPLKPVGPGARPRAHKCLERQGEIMPGRIDDKSTTSWFQRRLADGTTVSGDNGDLDAAAIAHSGKARDGWDPWEVWLRYIEQPRSIRRRDVRLK
jgi:hypothetical protein